MLHLTQRVATMLRYISEASPHHEVGGLGKTLLIPGGVLVRDLMIPKQLGTTATTDITGETVAAIMAELAQRGEVMGDWRCWWHIHPGKCDPSPSQKDSDTLLAFAEEMGWALGLIASRDMEYYGWMALADPFPADVEIAVIPPVHESRRLRRRVEHMMEGVEKGVAVITTGKVVPMGWPVSAYPMYTSTKVVGDDGRQRERERLVRCVGCGDQHFPTFVNEVGLCGWCEMDEEQRQREEGDRELAPYLAGLWDTP